VTPLAIGALLAAAALIWVIAPVFSEPPVPPRPGGAPPDVTEEEAEAVIRRFREKSG
jgi:hypothetical protein